MASATQSQRAWARPGLAERVARRMASLITARRDPAPSPAQPLFGGVDEVARKAAELRAGYLKQLAAGTSRDK
jgi:hypothetical protein